VTIPVLLYRAIFGLFGLRAYLGPPHDDDQQGRNNEMRCEHRAMHQYNTRLIPNVCVHRAAGSDVSGAAARGKI
jgi:hypothetical protein